MSNDRYVLTERIISNIPNNDDPKARAMKLHSGVFDMRDSKSSDVICCTSMNLPALRRFQASKNTDTYLNNIGM